MPQLSGQSSGQTVFLSSFTIPALSLRAPARSLSATIPPPVCRSSADGKDDVDRDRHIHLAGRQYRRCPLRGGLHLRRCPEIGDRLDVALAFVDLQRLVHRQLGQFGQRLSLLPRLLKGKARLALNRILNLTAGLICLILGWYAWKFILLEIEMHSQIAGVIPAWIVEIILPVGFLLLALTFFLKILLKSNPETQ